MKSNEKDIKTIIKILELMKNEDLLVDDYKIHPGGLKYLLGQVVRQLKTPQSKFYFSYGANLLWNEIKVISKDSIFDYYYQNRVVHENDVAIKISTYKRASSKPVERLLNKGEYFNFRHFFMMIM